MEENKNPAVAETAENAERTAEETPIYTQSQFDEKVRATVDESIGKKIARNNAKIRKEYESRYGELENVLKAGTGKESISEIAAAFKDYYKGKGIEIAPRAEYSEKDTEILAEAEANEIISAGAGEVTDELNRLAALGTQKMTARDKAVFTRLTQHRRNTERTKELQRLGVSEEVYGSPEFQSFAEKFDTRTPIAEVWDIYSKAQPKKEIKTAGSMKNSGEADSGVKDYYSFEEASRFTRKDFDSNPALFKAVQASMAKWK